MTVDLKDDQRLLHRVAHLRQIVLWAEELKSQWAEGASSERQRFVRALDLAHKILRDRQERGDQTLSIVDEEARRARHGDYYEGYMLDVSLDADSEIITSLDVLVANADEAANAVELLKQEEAAQGNDVQELSMDAIGYRGDLLHRLESPEEGLQVVLYTPVKEQPRKDATFSPAAFVTDETKSVLRCPDGKQTASFQRQKHGRNFLFSLKDCRACDLQQQCLSAETKTRNRRVFKSDYEEEYKRAKARADTEKYGMIRSEPAAIERKLADIVRNHQGRRARYRGLKRVKTQYFLTGLVVNIKRIVKKLFTVETEMLLPEG